MVAYSCSLRRVTLNLSPCRALNRPTISVLGEVILSHRTLAVLTGYDIRGAQDSKRINKSRHGPAPRDCSPQTLNLLRSQQFVCCAVIWRLDPDHRVNFVLPYVESVGELGRHRSNPAHINVHMPKLRIKPEAEIHNAGG